MNDPKYRTKALIDYVKNVIDGNGKLPKYEFTNLIVQIFEDKTKKIKQKLSGLIFVKKIYPIIFFKMLKKDAHYDEMEAMNDMIDESLIIDLVIRDEVLKDKDRQLVEEDTV